MSAEIINIRKNKLTGSIPSGIGALTRLEELTTNENRLTGALPNLSELSDLRVLSVRQNQINGTIPSSIGHLMALEVLQLRENQIVGPIPSEVGLLSALTDLNIHDNKVQYRECVGFIAFRRMILECVTFLLFACVDDWNNSHRDIWPNEFDSLEPCWH